LKPAPQQAWPSILLIGYWLVLLTSTHWPHVRAIDVPGKDKTLHVAAFGVLTALLLNVLVRRPALRHRWSIVVLALAIVGIYGALDERTQPWTGRTCDLFDWLADMAGAAMACLAYLVISAIRPVRRRSEGKE
jgi:VanZ family protein